MQANRPETKEQLRADRKKRRERALIAITLVLVVAITSLEVHLVHRGGQPVTGSLLAFGLLNINTFLLLLFTFLIFRHLSKLFLERRRKVFGSRLRTRLVLTFITPDPAAHPVPLHHGLAAHFQPGGQFLGPAGGGIPGQGR